MARPEPGRAGRAPKRVTGESATVLVKQVRRGLDYAWFARVKDALDLPVEAVADVVQITPRTLARRKREGRLRPDESDRVLRVARLIEKAVELCEGDADAARRWLTTPKRALGGETPLAFAKTEIGARAVENLVGRLEHGVVA